MWKNKKYGFTVTNVEFIGGWAKFTSSGIPCTLEEEKFLANYEEITK